MSDPASQTYHFEGTLQPSDSQTYLTYPFEVPASCAVIRLRLAYSPFKVGAIRNLVTVGLFDPKGFRGHAHRGPPDAKVIVSPSAATVGFDPGPLPAGRWQAQLNVHAILPSPEPCRFTFEIELLLGVPPETFTPFPPKLRMATKQAGWYRGEIHAHTIHSDGVMTPEELLAQARTRGLDFIAISDHNTISSWQKPWALPADGPLVIPSLELTTYHGHAVALGVDRWVDWRTGYNGWTINDAARATHDAGGLFIIAHPWSNGSPACTGCRWEYNDIDMALVDGIEAWSSFWTKSDNHNNCNLRFWREQLAAGFPPTALAAADVHSPRDWGDDIPITYVYADELSLPAIMAGIRRRRVTLSTGPWIELQTTAPRWVLMENVLTAGPTRTNVVASWRAAPPGARLRAMCATVLIDEVAVGEQGRVALNVPPGGVHLELWSSEGVLLALTNPISVTLQ